MANTKISALTALTNPTGSEEFVYAYNNANGKITLDTMKSFVGGTGITTLNADANIWELAAGFYETEYKLFYISGEDITNKGTLWNSKTLLFVVVNSDGGRGYFAFTERESSGDYLSSSCFGYSKSSADGDKKSLGDKEWALKAYGAVIHSPQPSIIEFADDSISQGVTGASGTNTITISSQNPPYVGMTYTIYVDSVESGDNYTVNLGTGVTNPLNIALPTSSDKKCVITCLITSSTTAVVTGCTIEA